MTAGRSRAWQGALGAAALGFSLAACSGDGGSAPAAFETSCRSDTSSGVTIDGAAEGNQPATPEDALRAAFEQDLSERPGALGRSVWDFTRAPAPVGSDPAALTRVDFLAHDSDGALAVRMTVERLPGRAWRLSGIENCDDAEPLPAPSPARTATPAVTCPAGQRVTTPTFDVEPWRPAPPDSLSALVRWIDTSRGSLDPLHRRANFTPVNAGDSPLRIGSADHSRSAVFAGYRPDGSIFTFLHFRLSQTLGWQFAGHSYCSADR